MMLRVREAAPLLRLSNLKDLISYLRPRDFDSWSEGLTKGRASGVADVVPCSS